MQPAIRTCTDNQRAFGWRKAGGLYLVYDGRTGACGKLPFALDLCDVCGAGFRPSRGWTWVNGTALVAERGCRLSGGRPECFGCPLGGRVGRVGLLWVVARHYPKPEDWLKEIAFHGICLRIASLPKEFKIGDAWVFIGHPRCFQAPDGSHVAGLINAFRPTRVEYAVRGDESPARLDRLVRRGITLVRVQQAAASPRCV